MGKKIMIKDFVMLEKIFLISLVLLVMKLKIARTSEGLGHNLYLYPTRNDT